MIYLASPYSHPDEAVRVARFEAVCRFAAQRIAEGLVVFSPIAHTHPIAVYGGLPLGFDFWREFDQRMIAACDALWVLCLRGWRHSRGIAEEISIARGLGKPCVFIDARGRLRKPARPEVFA